MTDPLAAAVSAHKEALAAKQAMSAASTHRAEAVRLAIDSGHTHKEIADALEVSRPRVYQMLGK